MTSPGSEECDAECCRVCGGVVTEVFRSQLPLSASSGCVPVPHPARVVRCGVCGLLQKLAADLTADYRHYDIFDNDPSADKIIRTAGKPDRTRGQFVADLMSERLPPASKARVLEIGCHRGAFLSTLHSSRPEWELHGFDRDPSYARWIEPMCGAGHYHDGSLETVPGVYDACVLIHTLEHIPDPLTTLRIIRRKLVPGGVLLIVVPDVVANPADLLTIDHTCHFADDQLSGTLARAGFASTVDASLITNELVAVASPVESEPAISSRYPRLPEDFPSLRRFERSLCTLPAEDRHVFGTAVVAALIAGMLSDRCVGFVDEAPFRIGKTFLERRVRSPQEVIGETVVLGVAERVAEQLAPRLEQLGLRVINPWAGIQ
jgi:SAM-dependent methyltransferase